MIRLKRNLGQYKVVSSLRYIGLEKFYNKVLADESKRGVRYGALSYETAIAQTLNAYPRDPDCGEEDIMTMGMAPTREPIAEEVTPESVVIAPTREQQMNRLELLFQENLDLIVSTKTKLKDRGDQSDSDASIVEILTGSDVEGISREDQIKLANKRNLLALQRRVQNLRMTDDRKIYTLQEGLSMSGDEDQSPGVSIKPVEAQPAAAAVTFPARRKSKIDERKNSLSTNNSPKDSQLVGVNDRRGSILSSQEPGKGRIAADTASVLKVVQMGDTKKFQYFMDANADSSLDFQVRPTFVTESAGEMTSGAMNFDFGSIQVNHEALSPIKMRVEDVKESTFLTQVPQSGTRHLNLAEIPPADNSPRNILQKSVNSSVRWNDRINFLFDQTEYHTSPMSSPHRRAITADVLVGRRAISPNREDLISAINDNSPQKNAFFDEETGRLVMIPAAQRYHPTIFISFIGHF